MVLLTLAGRASNDVIHSKDHLRGLSSRKENLTLQLQVTTNTHNQHSKGRQGEQETYGARGAMAAREIDR